MIFSFFFCLNRLVSHEPKPIVRLLQLQWMTKWKKEWNNTERQKKNRIETPTHRWISIPLIGHLKSAVSIKLIKRSVVDSNEFVKTKSTDGRANDRKTERVRREDITVDGKNENLIDFLPYSTSCFLSLQSHWLVLASVKWSSNN